MKLFYTLFFLLFAGATFSQPMVTRDIQSFGARGDGKTNDHEAFERAAAFFNSRGGYGKLIIGKGVYRVGKQSFNRENNGQPVFGGSDLMALTNVTRLSIEGKEGAVLKYSDGLRFGAFNPLTGQPYLHGNNYFVNLAYQATVGSAFLLTNCTDVQITGLELNGNSDGLLVGGVYGDVGIQLPHIGLNIKNSTQITVDNVNAHHFGLDGIMVGNSTGKNAKPDKIVIRNSQFEYNARQGLSWIGGNDLTALNCRFNHSGRGKFSSAPGAGVDIEAEMGLVKSGKFVNCEFINNAGNGLVADSGPSSDCTFTNCTFWGVTSWSIWVNKPGFTFVNSRIYGSFVHGYGATNDAEATKFVGCLFEDRPYNGKEPYGNFLVETNYKKRVRFDDCTFIAHKKKIVWMESDPAWKPEEKYQLNNCRLIFTGDSTYPEGWIALTRNIRFRNCTFALLFPKAEQSGYGFNGLHEPYNVNLGGNKIVVNKKEVAF